MTRRCALVCCLLAAVPAGSSSAQEREDAPRPLALTVEPSDGSVTLQLGDLLSGAGLRDALESGLPIRIRIITELWRDRFFDSQEGREEWRATLAYDVLERRFVVQTRGSPDNRSRVGSFEEAASLVQQQFRVPLVPPGPGRYYYLATLEVETLSLSDLEELQRWLRGELAPAVTGDRRVEGALAEGMGRVIVRMLGLPTRRERLRTPTFEVSADGSARIPPV